MISIQQKHMLNKLGLIQGRLLKREIKSKLQSFPWSSWQKEFFLMKKIGLKNLEWTLDYKDFLKNPINTKKGNVIIKKLKKKYNIQIQSITCDFFMQKPFFKKKNKFCDEDFYFFFNKILSSKIKTIVIPLVDNSSIKSKKIEKKVINFFLGLQKKLKKYKKSIAFEIDYPPKKVKQFINKFPKKYYGINYDLGNSASLGYKVKEEFKQYKNRIINIHLKDRVYNGSNVRFGKGNADFENFFKEIKKMNYSGKLILQSSRSKSGHHEKELIKNINHLKNYSKI